MKQMTLVSRLMTAVVLSAAVAAQSPKPASELKIIDGPRIEAVTDKTAQIAWSTNVESSATVHFGTDPNHLDQIAQQQWGGEKTQVSAVHRVILRALKPNATYYFTVESGEGWHQEKNVAKSEVKSLTTKMETESAQEAAAAPANPTVTGPVTSEANGFVAGPLVANVTDRSATLWWMATDDHATTVAYGRSKSKLDQKLAVPTGEIKKVELTKLEPNTSYFVAMADGNGKNIYEGTFKTESSGFARAPFKIVQGPMIEMVGRNTATITWSTSARSSSVVRFGTDPNTISQSVMAPWGQQIHRVQIKGLKPNTRYFFQVESAQAEGSGLSAKSNAGTFKTVNEGQAALRNPEWR